MPDTVVAKTEAAEGMPAEEWQARVDLAACFRLVAMFGWDDLVATHISVRVPGRRDEFLINPLGVLFDEMTASVLQKIDLDGKLLVPSAYPVNAAGFNIHSAIHSAVDDAHCVLHLHTLDGMAVSSLEDGLIEYTQTAMLLGDDVAYHEYEGVVTNPAERERLLADLGVRRHLILRNHGTLAVGETVGAAFARIYHLERACTVQVRTLGMGGKLHRPQESAYVQVASLGGGKAAEQLAKLAWPALRRRVDRVLPGYDQ
jgi:ribulose-5-phosphate 4-epimerase/fuculose-1-phosphate aldolase